MDRSFPFLVLVWFIFSFYSNFLILVYGNIEGDALNAQKEKFTDPTNVLHDWDATLPNPCEWPHVSCNNENSVTRVDLGNANLSGQLVQELDQLSNLQYLELSNNNITGKIPSELGNLTQLVSLDLFLNQLDGDIPATLGKLQKLRFLRLNNNKLRGTIPSSLTTINTLKVLDLSSNLLSGFIPVNGSFKLFTNTSFANNTNQLIYPPSDANKSTTAIAGGVAGAALLFGTLIALAWWRCRQRPDRFFDLPAEEDPANHLRQLKRFSLHELQVATDNFSKNKILGRGGFGHFYKGRLADGSPVAVKRLKKERKNADELQFQTEVKLISLAVHRNLLRLIGFCMTQTERLLVYPYMVNGSVASCLKGRPNTKPALDWATRTRIAVGSARGLAYLHDHCTPKIIHRDVKAANIMLDEEFEAVVGDFGLARLMDYKATHVTTAVRGTIGHIAPEYISTGRSSEKTDVYGYGVMLLELITGQQAYDLARLQKDDSVMLLDWQFKVEIISLAVHWNLLRLIGFCMTPTERLLVYPYMINGSVASCLKGQPNTKPALDWATRKRIAVGSARGLAYLHDHCTPKIIHCDVKAANIMLDEEFEAFVGDFGLAKLLYYNATHVTTGVRGTIGHIAPEYLSTGRCSEKTDIYGYGVMLLELITGQQAFDLAHLQKDDSVMLLDWVKGLLEDKKLETIVDSDIEVNGVNDDVERLIQIALLCTQEKATERPNMSEVIRMLEGDGLANKWEEWQEEDISRQKFSNTDIPYPYSVEIISNYTPSADQLSAPR